MTDQSVVFEELLVAIDFAGRLQGDDMRGNANPQTFAPDGANAINDMFVSAMSNGDQLGASTVYMILEGGAFPDGPHEIVIGGHGGENIDLANEGSAPTHLTKMGIRVKAGGQYTVNFQAVGDTQDEFGCCAELIFTSRAPEGPKKWVASHQVTAAVDTNVQGENLTAVVGTVSPEDSTRITSIIGCGAGDMAALGCHHIVAILSGGCQPRQECLLAGVGGELVIGAGAHISPSQRFVDYPVQKNTNIYVEFRGVNEAGVMQGAISIGFAQ